MTPPPSPSSSDRHHSPASSGPWAAVARLWMRLQVELQGQYSLERLRRVLAYTRAARGSRILGLCLFVPVPCLAFIAALELVRVEPPARGPAESPCLWIRCGLTLELLTFFLLEQLRHLTPAFPFSRFSAVIIATIAAITTVVGLVSAALCVGYPLPFTVAMGLPLWLATTLTTMAGAWRLTHHRRGAESPKSRSLGNYATLLLSQIAPTAVYTVFALAVAVVADAGARQVTMVLALPTLKLLTKNAISWSLRDIDDLKPEAVIFNIEIFHALFVTCTLQTTTSATTVLTLVLVDALQMLLAAYDLYALLADARALATRLRIDGDAGSLALADLLTIGTHVAETDRSMKTQSTLRASCWRADAVHHRGTFSLPGSAIDLKELEKRSRQRSRTSTILPLALARRLAQLSASDVLALAPKRTRRDGIRIAPVGLRPSSSGASSNDSSPIVPSQRPRPPERGVRPNRRSLPARLDAVLEVMSESDRLVVVRATLQVYYLTEFLALVEFTEVIVPVVYGVCVVITSSLGNRDSYLFLRDVDTRTTLGAVAGYAALELGSFVALSAILWRRLRISLPHQLAFVLDTHWTNVQAKLIVWVVYIIQTSLVQLGADYTFQFRWLHDQTA